MQDLPVGIYKRPETGRYRYEYTFEGQRVRKQAPGGTLESAMAKLREAQKAIALGLDPRETEAKGYTVKQAVTDYLVKATKPGVYSPYNGYATVITEEFGTLPANRLAEDHLFDLRSSLLEDEAAPITANKYLGFLRASLNYARDRKKVTRNIFDQFKSKHARARLFAREDQAPIVPVTSDEFEAIMEHMDARFDAPLRLLLATGMRRGEGFGLMWGELSSRKDGIVISLEAARTKSEYGRDVPLTAGAQALLPPQPINATKKTRVFADANVNSVGVAWWRARQLAAAKIPRCAEIRIHDLRHTFASRFLAAGGLPIALRDICGWKSIAMLDRYSHALAGQKRSGVDAMEAAQ